MFNLLASYNDWNDRHGTIPIDRVVNKYTTDEVRAVIAPNGSIDFNTLKRLPTIFAGETNGLSDQIVRVGRLVEVRSGPREISLEYLIDPAIPPIRQTDLIRLAPALGITLPSRGIGELSTTHWAVKDADLFHILMSEAVHSSRHPIVFDLPTTQIKDQNLLSAMMPFAGFGPVYTAIQAAATANGMRCNRADDVWENPAIIQDTVSLIDRSSIIIIDCSNRNANVFYELGLAHAWGKEVILITQSPNDIPFDIQHIRHIRYYNSEQGIQELERQLTEKIRTLR